jgi:sugar lactone lactonase YvrE
VRRYVLPGERVFPEGITEGPGSAFFVGSLGDGTIFRGDVATGEVEVFLGPDGDGRQAIAALDIDGYGRLIACDFDGGQVFGYDLASGRLAARHVLAAGSLPNDVVAAGDMAYATDSGNPVIWRLSAGPGGIGEPEVAIDLSRFGAADPAASYSSCARRSAGKARRSRPGSRSRSSAPTSRPGCSPQPALSGQVSAVRRG